MYKFTVIAPSDLKERWITEGCADYFRKMSSDAAVETAEFREAKNPDANVAVSLEEEAARILPLIKNGAYVVALCVEGREMSSEALAGVIDSAVTSGHSSIAFIIGSSYGLSPKVKAAADLQLSMSRLTLPHRLARLVLAEAIYRSVAILKNKNYHK